MKVVYILTSTREDFYLEQLILSAYSLRQHNPTVEICVLADCKTLESFDGTRNLSSVELEPMLVDCPADLTTKERSRFLEFETRKIIRGDFLYMDSDTVVADSLDGIEKHPGHVLAVRDKHTTIITPPVVANLKKSKLHFPEQFGYFNSGLFFSRDTLAAAKFFDDWKTLWLGYKTPSFCLDQPAFNFANVINNHIIKELDGIWNCQIFRNGVKFLSEAKMIHYYSVNDKNNPYLLAHHNCFRAIRNNHCKIPAEMADMLKTPRALIFPSSRVIIRDDQISVIDSSIFGYLSEKLVHHKLTFRILNKFFSYLN